MLTPLFLFQLPLEPEVLLQQVQYFLVSRGKSLIIFVHLFVDDLELGQMLLDVVQVNRFFFVKSR